MIVAARLGVLLLVAGLAAWALGHHDAGPAPGRYACAMHPQVVGREPGPCPVCGMALAPVRAPSPVQAERLLTYGAAPVHRRALGETAESPAWVDGEGGVTAVLFQDELRDLGPGEGGLFFAARAPEVPLAVERAEAPAVRWRGSMWRVRFRFRAGRPPGLRVGATGRLERSMAGRQSLVVLSSAVLQSQAGPYLLASSPDRGAYHRQPITTGRVGAGYTAVVSGARERDLVFGLNAFSLDAQAQLQAQRRAAAPP